MGNPRWSAVVSEEVTAFALTFRHDERTLRRFWEKVDLGFEPTDCWIWTAALSDEGYGDFWLGGRGGRTIRAHRLAWIWRHGDAPPPATPFLDHAVTCLGRFCISPLHLEPVDEAENQRRRTNVGAATQRFLRSTALALRDERRTAGEEGVF
ncbi:MAG: hypothetical protein K2X91_13975 [Thermoleophilia bacterium]|nr:hypothetical protein [Thermoleophilia bacterium]